MGLFGALYAGVSGLDSQSNVIGIISNNISNVNTVGYKQGAAAFDTLVVPSGSTGTFSPGGVLSNNKQLVDQQGIIQGTSSGTDVAISGGGMFVVNSQANGTGQELFTRAGGFTQDALGNFVNTTGLFLQGWPLDANGNIPSDSANFTSLKTVNIKSNTSGAATPTSLITLAANLNASQSVLLGSGETVNFNGSSLNNVGISASELIAGSEGNGGSPNGIIRGDSFTIGSNGGSTSSTYTYGGFAIGRDITSTVGSNTGLGDGAAALDQETLTGVGTTGVGTTNGSTTVTLTLPTTANAADYVVGKNISISGVTGTVGGLPASDINGTWSIIANAVGAPAGTVTFTIGTAAQATAVASSANGGSAIIATNRTYPFAGNMLDAQSTTDLFLGQAGTAPFSSNALNFEVATSSGGTSTFRYVSSAPDTTKGQFNSLQTLATAINNTAGLTARVVDNQLYVGSTNPNDATTFINGDATGNPNATSPATPTDGINWVQELGLANVSAAAQKVNRFDTLTSLASQINSVGGATLAATVNNPLGSSTLSINENNPEQTISFSDGDATGASPGGSLLKEFSFVGVGGQPIAQNGSHTSGTGVILNTTGTLPDTYVATDPTKNMSSGAVTPQFSRDITVYDALGNSHTVAFNVAKLSSNTWAVELTAVPATDVNAATSPNGQLASGIVSFKGNGTLASLSSSLQNSITVPWTNGATASQLKLNLGTYGATDGLSQYSSAFNVSLANQNGSSVGQLTGVSIDQTGFVIASFSNGQTQKIYQVPLAQVNNPDGLTSVSGNAYEQTNASGVANLAVAGTNGTGTLDSSSLEQSNVDLSSQLTNLIVAQQAYGANTRVLTITDQLLQQLDQIIQ